MKEQLTQSTSTILDDQLASSIPPNYKDTSRCNSFLFTFFIIKTLTQDPIYLCFYSFLSGKLIKTVEFTK
jgi:hypothetical protein